MKSSRFRARYDYGEARSSLAPVGRVAARAQLYFTATPRAWRYRSAPSVGVAVTKGVRDLFVPHRGKATMAEGSLQRIFSSEDRSQNIYFDPYEPARNRAERNGRAAQAFGACSARTAASAGRFHLSLSGRSAIPIGITVSTALRSTLCGFTLIRSAVDTQ